MADPKQLAILAQGAEAWNEWRSSKPEIQADLNGAKLIGADLSKADLTLAHSNGALADVAVRLLQLGAPDDDVGDLSLLVRIIGIEPRALRVDVNLIAHLFEDVHEIFLLP